MMLFKLSLRNIKKSMRDYVIYFATLILGVAIFYVFNAVGEQSAMLCISEDTREMIGYLVEVMPVVSVFVAAVLGFLVVYANTFLMKRRKKEFGIYMLLGMNKSKISAILVIETILIGGISLVIGLLIGVTASQGMSILVANMFEADLTSFHFTVSGNAITKTLIYFLIMYVVVIVLDVFVVGKSKLISLLQAGKKNQKNFAKNPIVCAICFLIAVILLGTAYYNVTAGMRTIREFNQLATEVGKGIVGTFLLFWSLSGLLILLVKSNKRFYFKGLNSFSTKELSSRVNTTVFSSSVICLLLFFCICILSSAVSIKRSLDANMKELVPMDVQFEVWGVPMEDGDLLETLKERNVPVDEMTDFVEANFYLSEDVTVEYEIDGSVYSSWMPCMKVSDYNRVASAFGKTTYQLDSGMYMAIANYGEVLEEWKRILSNGSSFTLDGVEYHPLYSEAKNDFLEMSNTADNAGIILLPDDANITNVEYSVHYLFANFKNQDKKARRDLDARLRDINIVHELDVDELGEENHYMNTYTVEEDGEVVEYGTIVNMTSKIYLYDSGVGISVMVIFVGSYLGIVFLISSGAILALKELSEAADNKEKYQMLRKIGVDEKMLHRSLLSQCGVFFGLPLFIGVIHSVFGMQTASNILFIFGKSGFISALVISGLIILLIYGIYFALTYACCRKIISE